MVKPLPKRGLACTVCLTAGLAGFTISPALAQPIAADANSTIARQVEANSSTERADDIIVTARRRAEAVTDVPVAIAAFGGDDLTRRGISRLEDLQSATPALRVVPTNSRRANSQYEIRGVSAFDSLITIDPAVGVYTDEVYRGRSYGVSQSMFDIANVQVLYGPQGTLFGRNSSAGAVLINTKRPTDRLEGSLSAGYGSLDRYELTGVINLPLSEKVALRAAGQWIKRDGYGTNTTTGRQLANTDTLSGRVSIAYNPSEMFSNVLVASYYRGNDRGVLNALYALRPCPSATATSPLVSCSSYGPTATAIVRQLKAAGYYALPNDAVYRDFEGDRTPIFGPDPYERSRNFTVVNTATLTVSDKVKIKTITAYDHHQLKADTDLDGTPLQFTNIFLDTSGTQFSQELQVQGASSRLDWVVGLMYFYERGVDKQYTDSLSIALVPTSTFQDLLGVNESYAAFAQGSYKILPSLSLTLGGRYTKDNRSATYINPQTRINNGASNCTFPAALGLPSCFAQRRVEFSQPTYTASLDFKPARGTLLYIAHRRGYRSGGLQPRVANSTLGFNAFRPETVTDVEIGAKGDFRFGAEGSASFSLAAYRAKYNDMQKLISVPTGLPTPLVTSIIVNAAKATVKGFEAQFSVRPVRFFELSGFWAHVDGHYDEFLNNGRIFTDVPFSSAKDTWGGSATITPIDSTEIGRVSLTANYARRSAISNENTLPIVEPEGRLPAQGLANLHAEWRGVMGSGFSLEAWMRNVFDKTALMGVTSQASSFGYVTAVIGEPRTYGLTVKYEFGR